MEFQEDDVADHVDWSIFFDGLPEGTDLLAVDSPVLEDPSLGNTFSIPSPSSDSSWINEIENMLMQEDDNLAIPDATKEFCDTFLADILLDFREEDAGEVIDSAVDMVPSTSDDGKSFNSDKANVDEADADDKESEKADTSDPISKKRRRQLRNRDSALRSRERKKSYVKDLETKSRYLEGECRRLGRLLQCCYAENQALRHNLHMGFVSGSSVAKQESAVLLLESLLLGSLLWFMGVMCLFTLPQLPHPILEPVPPVENVVADQAKTGLRGGGSKNLDRSFARSRRCRSAKRKMKPCSLIRWMDGVF